MSGISTLPRADGLAPPQSNCAPPPGPPFASPLFMVTRRSLALVLTTSLLARIGLASPSASIVPGERIGAVSLGMNESTVHRALREPQRVHKLRGGITQKIWLRPLNASELAQERANGRHLRWNYLMVYFRAGHVQQIEASSAAFETETGLSILKAPNSFRSTFPGYRFSQHLFYNRDPEKMPAGKHFVWYEDAVSSGIAWKYGAWANGAPDPDPSRPPLDTIIVHRKGKPLVVDPDGGVSLVQH